MILKQEVEVALQDVKLREQSIGYQQDMVLSQKSDLYENIVDEEKGKLNEDGTLNLNPNSLTVLKDCYVEPNIADVKPEDKFQFVRQGYFCADLKDYTKEKPVFNRIVSLKSSFKLPK